MSNASESIHLFIEAHLLEEARAPSFPLSNFPTPKAISTIARLAHDPKEWIAPSCMFRGLDWPNERSKTLAEQFSSKQSAATSGGIYGTVYAAVSRTFTQFITPTPLHRAA
jgi:hypothetical protein